MECILSWAYLAYVAPEMGQSRRSLLSISRRSFRGLRSYFSLALPATLQGCVETWYWETSSLVVGYLGALPLAGHIVAYSVTFVAVTPLLGLQMAVATLVGNMLGANKPDEARRYCWVAVALSLLVWTVPVIIMCIWPMQLVGLFDPDVNVQRVAVTLLTYYAIAGYFDHIQYITAAVLRVSGKPTTVSVCYFVIYFGVMLLLGCILAFPMHHGVDGYWQATPVGTGLAAVVYGVLCWRLRWSDVAAEAQERIKNESEEAGCELTAMHS